MNISNYLRRPRARFALPAVLALIAVSLWACDSGVKAEERPPHTRGNADAAVTVVEFGDFQCGACRSFFSGTAQQIKSDYVDTGLVQFQFRHYPFIGEESFIAAEATECANDQGKFWEFHDTLFKFQTPVNSGTFTVDQMKDLARGSGLNGAEFDDCIDSERGERFVQFDLEAAEDLGVNSTPTVFINGVRINGNRDYAIFRDAIQQALLAAS